MIDWLSFTVKIDHTIPALGGYRTNLDHKRNLTSEFTTFAQLSGTFQKTMMVKSQNEVSNIHTGERTFTELYFSGNPIKVLQGHNIYGTDDIHSLLYATLELTISKFNLDIDIREIFIDDINLIKVDVNYSYFLKNERHVEMWINSAERTASLPYAGRGVLKSNTSLVFAEKSKHYRFKAYGKHQELNARRKDSKDLPQGLIDFTHNILRVELEAKRILKAKGLNHLRNWTLETPRKLFNEYLSNMNISDNVVVPDDKLHLLTPTQQTVYRNWLDGYDMKTLYPKTSFYRFRKTLKEKISVDIALRNNNKNLVDTTNVVPLIQYIKAEPMQMSDIPDEFKEGVLYFEPNQLQRFG